MSDHGRTLVAALALIGLVAGLTPTRAGAATKSHPIGVREFMTGEVAAGSGARTVEGVVSQVFPDNHMLALIDLSEFRECVVVTCAELTLPVQWQGSSPAVTSVVRVTGRVEQQGVRRVFIASGLEVVEPPRGGTQ